MRCTNTTMFAFCVSLWTSSAMSTVLLQGDAAPTTGQSFTFSVGGHVAGRGSFYVAADPTQAGAAQTKENALSVVWQGQTKFIPLTPQAVTINGAAVNPNPLYNKLIQHLGLMQIYDTSSVMPVYTEYPFVVPADDQKSIYLLNPPLVADKISMLSATNILSANPAVVTSGIVGIASGGNSIFAAVKPGIGTFGQVGSGVALLARTTEEVTEADGKSTKTVLKYFSTTALDKSSASLRFATGGDLQLGTQVNDMWMDANLGLLYIALSVRADGSANSGARALVVGFVNKNNAITFRAIAPDVVFVGDNEIVGTATPGARVTLHKIRTMQTSTWLHYAIMVGGNGDAANTQNLVRAVPLVTDPYSTSFGTLAKYDSDPQDLYIGDPNVHMAFNNRFYNTAATSNADILKMDDTQAIVGGGDAPGNVLDMAVIGDSVVIAVEVVFADGVTQRQLYASRTLFDEKGRINGWTQWQTVASSIGLLSGFFMDGVDASITGLVNDTPNVDADVKIVRRSVWGGGDTLGLGDLNTVLSAQFPQELGGIHGMFDFPEFYNGVHNATFAIMTGRKKVALVETGRGNPLQVNKGNFSANTVLFENGAVTQTFPVGGATRVVVMSGGALDTIGAIQCAEIAYGVGAFVCVGGVGGLAILSQPDGSGTPGFGLFPGFNGLVAGMAFKMLGNYTFVRKLVADNEFLYVLTDTQFDRIDMRTTDFDTVTLATAEGIGASFLDCIVSSQLAVLATSKGVLRSGNDVDVRTVAVPAEALWTAVALPEISGPAQELIAVTKNGLAQDLENGGNLFVLSSYEGKNRGKWSRLVVTDYNGAAVSDTTLQPFPDIFVRSVKTNAGVNSYLASFGTYRPLLAPGSALQLTAKDKDLNKLATLDMISPLLKSGQRYAYKSLQPVDAAMSTVSDINGILRSSGSGDLLAAMDAGLRVNEFGLNTVDAAE